MSESDLNSRSHSKPRAALGFLSSRTLGFTIRIREQAHINVSSQHEKLVDTETILD